MRTTIFISFIFIASLAFAELPFWHPGRVNPEGKSCPEQPEIGMIQNMRISVNTSDGRVDIYAKSKFDRTFTWGDNCSKNSTLGARGVRWYGSCGLTDPAFRLFPWIWGCEGISRVVAEDSILNLKDEQEIEEFIEVMKEDSEIFYNNQGLVVTYLKNLDDYALHIQVFQILLNGKKPNSILGADDHSIKVRYMNSNL